MYLYTGVTNGECITRMKEGKIVVIYGRIGANAEFALY